MILEKESVYETTFSDVDYALITLDILSLKKRVDLVWIRFGNFAIKKEFFYGFFLMVTILFLISITFSSFNFFISLIRALLSVDR